MSESESDRRPAGFFGQIFSLAGRLDRTPYAVTGLILALVKFNIDRAAADAAFDRSWKVLRYYVQPTAILDAPADEAQFLLSMAAISVPFVVIGVWLTARRLRSVGWPAGWSVLFFVPLTNLTLFLTLCVVPTRDGLQLEEFRERADAIASRLIPESAWGSVGVALVTTVPLSLGAVLVGAWGLQFYGWGLFLGIPFWLGLASVTIYGYHRKRSFAASMGVSLLSVFAVSVLLLALAIEGAVCIVMAAPIGTVLALFGGTVGYFIQWRAFDRSISTAGVLGLFALLPFAMGLETVDPVEPPEMAVESSIAIDAPPEVVWEEVVTFGDLPEPSDWIFETGVAYPTHAEIDGRGEGAVRRCVFSTGAFVEPITVWDAPHRLAFDVREQPPAMDELSPWGAIDPPHVDSFFRSQRGEFRLVDRADGGTRLVGTTWYRHRVWPVHYWRIWSDELVHRIHMRVLKHIRDEAERRVSAASSTGSR